METRIQQQVIEAIRQLYECKYNIFLSIYFIKVTIWKFIVLCKKNWQFIRIVGPSFSVGVTNCGGFDKIRMQSVTIKYSYNIPLLTYLGRKL